MKVNERRNDKLQNEQSGFLKEKRDNNNKLLNGVVFGRI